jgi:hypothetical protein
MRFGQAGQHLEIGLRALKKLVRGVRLEPVHDQTGDFGFALEVREVPDRFYLMTEIVRQHDEKAMLAHSTFAKVT